MLFVVEHIKLNLSWSSNRNILLCNSAIWRETNSHTRTHIHNKLTQINLNGVTTLERSMKSSEVKIGF